MKPLNIASLCVSTRGRKTAFNWDLYQNVTSNFSDRGIVLDTLYFTVTSKERLQLRRHIR